MANYISEAHIEEADIQLFKDLDYDFINADGKQLLGRESLKEVVLKRNLRRSLTKLNKDLPASCIEDAIAVLTQPLNSISPLLANKQIYGYIKGSIKVEYEKEGQKHTAYVKVVDFQVPTNNDFLVVQQLSIEYLELESITRRPDLLLYVNGLPLVYIELKNPAINIKKGYDVNLKDYKKDIPQLFYYNLFVCISNGIKTRVGSFNAEWEHFFPWARLKDSAEGGKQKTLLEIEKQGEAEKKKITLQYFSEGLCKKENLIDYLENFILYHKNRVKIIAKNHQFLGVNSAFKSFENRKGKDGKLGIFWQTQGSGKSYSMIFFAKKIHRKIGQNFSFLIVTDRSDLDSQIFRNFSETEIIKLQTGDGEMSKGEQRAAENFYRPKSRKQLLEYLQLQKKYVFAMVFKFGLKKGKQMKQVSGRDDWVVIIDEAHRTQYKGLADNMRIALPNAQYIAFTGTPIFKSALTKNWFGDCVSKYDFLQAIEDGATVPLFYKRGVPRVKQVNEELTDEVDDLFNSENLTEEQIRKLENEYATIMEVVKRDDRLEEVAKHIVNHFPYRLDVRDDEGNRRPMKAMVISIDKFTAVRMHDKVQRLKKIKLRELIDLIYKTSDPEEKARLRSAKKFLEETKMAVVISEEAEEDKKFEKEGLIIKPHRKLMDEPDENGQNIEDYFKDPDNVYRIVFVTAMWLTGFDAPSVSTLYLDKPMKMHTLMQAIARCNRVFEGKKNGLVVDYFGVFRNLKKAFSIYIETTKDKEGKPVEHFPAQVFSELLKLIEEAIKEGMAYCKDNGVDLQAILDIGEKGFKEIELFQDYADILLKKDDVKKKFNLYTNTITSLYDSARPEIYQRVNIKHTKEVFEFLQNIVNRNQDQQSLDEARGKMADILDKSIKSQGDLANEPTESYTIKEYDRFDLSKFDIEELKKEFKEKKHKHIAFTDLRELLQYKLRQMLRSNSTYVHFVIRYEQIIDSYNSDSISLQEAIDGLGEIMDDMSKAEKERISMGMTPEQKEIFDLLKKDTLTKAERKRVEKAAIELFEYLDGEKGRVLVVDWHKTKQTREKVKTAIVKVLSEHLPESYGRAEFTKKMDKVFQRFRERAEGDGRDNAAA